MLATSKRDIEATSRSPSISSRRSIEDPVAAPAAEVIAVSPDTLHVLSPNISQTTQTESSRPPVLKRKSNLSTSHSSKGLYALAKGKTSNILSSISVKSKNSAASLKSKVPLHSKKISASTAASSGDLFSSLSSGGTQSSASSIHEEFIGKSSGKPIITLDRQPIDSSSTVQGRKSADRRKLLDPSPSPSLHITDNHPPKPSNKMHQTSSRLLRMTEDERPYTRDFKDLFATLMVSLPLTSHRIRFQKIDHTFTSEEAINNLGSLKFSQSNRMPDPKDASRIVTTTTTTTFSMAKEMARSVCQRFMDARFIEAADGKPTLTFPLKSAVWQMTPKGMHVLQRFCQRNGITQRHVLDVLDSARNTMHSVILERDFATDKLDHDRATIEVIFRRFVGIEGMNVKSSTTVSDSDSVSDYYDGLIGVKMAKERKINDRVVLNTFTGKAAADWLMDCSSTVDRRESKEICELFVKYALIYQAFEDRAYVAQYPSSSIFQPTRIAIYGLTEKGQMVSSGRGRSPEIGSKDPAPRINLVNGDGTTPRDSNTNRLLLIVNDPALRLLFREYLRATHCEENLSFFMEVREFTQNYDAAEKAGILTRLDAIRESLAAAYGECYSVRFNYPLTHMIQDFTMLFLPQAHHVNSISTTTYEIAWLQE